MGVPYLLYSCSSAEKRNAINKTTWLLKLLVLGFVANWTVETYELVSV